MVYLLGAELILKCIRRNKAYVALFQIARKVGDPNTPRPWSRYSAKKQDNLTEATENTAAVKGSALTDFKGGKKDIENGENDDDPQLQEFLQLMQPRVKSKMWANDIVLDTPVNQSSKATEKKDVAEKADRQTSAPVESNSDETSIASDENETKASDNVARDEVISDMDYFKSRVKKDWSDSESDDDEENDDEDDDGQKGRQKPLSENVIQDETQEDSSKDLDGEILDPGSPSLGVKDDRDEVLESGRLFVRNLPYTATYIPVHNLLVLLLFLIVIKGISWQYIHFCSVFFFYSHFHQQ